MTETTARLPKSYGDVTSEYRAVTAEVARVEGLSDLIWVEGPDAVSFLQELVSQELASAVPGSVVRSFLLSPQGKLEALCWLLRGEDRVGVVTDSGLGDQVAERLGFYRIRVKAEIRQDDRELWELWGPRAEATAGIETGRWEERETSTVASLPLPGSGRVLVAGGLELGDVPKAGALAVTAVRVEAGEPVMGRDVDASTIPHETGLVADAVSFAKGCFVGYELVERIEARGATPPRRLRGIVITRNVLPPEGATVIADDAEVGTLTSVAESLRVGAPVGLSLLKRTVEPGTEVLVRWDGGEVPAVVRALPLV